MTDSVCIHWHTTSRCVHTTLMTKVERMNEIECIHDPMFICADVVCKMSVAAWKGPSSQPCTAYPWSEESYTTDQPARAFQWYLQNFVTREEDSEYPAKPRVPAFADTWRASQRPPFKDMQTVPSKADSAFPPEPQREVSKCTTCARESSVARRRGLVPEC